MQEIYYLNHKNEKLNLLELPYRLRTGDFFKYSWSYESTSNISKLGGKITRFHRGIAEKNLALSILSFSLDQFYSALNYFLEITEIDVLSKNPGKLYVGNQYITCYLVESEKTEWENEKEFLNCNIKLISEYPFWIVENDYSFDVQEIISSNNKRYTGKYAYRYANNLTDKKLTNYNFASSNIRIVIYGPAINPLIIIGRKTYAVNLILTLGEYLSIDTANKTIEKTQNNGTIINMFNSRVKTYDVFAQVESGTQKVSWDGDFAFNITVFEERSEPKWIL